MQNRLTSFAYAWLVNLDLWSKFSPRIAIWEQQLHITIILSCSSHYCQVCLLDWLHCTLGNRVIAFMQTLGCCHYPMIACISTNIPARTIGLYQWKRQQPVSIFLDYCLNVHIHHLLRWLHLLSFSLMMALTSLFSRVTAVDGTEENNNLLRSSKPLFGLK